MTPEDYLWYSKAVLLTIATLTCIGVFLRWKTESSICRPLAYMSLFLGILCIIDIVVCRNFDDHPLMLKSGGSFGILFFILIVISFSYLYAIELFNPVKVTFKLLLRLNLGLVISLVGYIVLSVFKIDFSHDQTWWGVNSVLSLWWLVTTISIVVYAVFVNLKMLKWTLGSVGKAKRDNPKISPLQCYGLFIPYVLFSLAVMLLCMFSFFKLAPDVEAPCFLVISVILFLLYIYSHFYRSVVPVKSIVHKESLNVVHLPEKQLIRVNDRLLIEKLTRLMKQEELYKSKELTTDVLAQRLGVSRKKLYLFLKEQYSATFSDYVNGIRLECAEQLMSSKEHIDLSIALISEMSGFNSVKTFNKFFKAKHATTPNKYRNTIEF